MIATMRATGCHQLSPAGNTETTRSEWRTTSPATSSGFALMWMNASFPLQNPRRAREL